MTVKRTVLLVLLLTAMCTALLAQSITLSNIGMKSPYNNGTTAVLPGDEIELKFEYLTTGFIEQDGYVEGACVNTSNLNKIRIYWNDAINFSGDSTTEDITVESFDYTVGITNGTTYYSTITFELPSPPTGAKSFKVRSRVFGDDGDMNTVASGAIYSGTGITDYYGHFNINSNTAPYATDVAITNPTCAKVGQTLTGTYTFNDDDTGDSEASSTFRWLRAESAAGSYTAISGATSQTYTVQSADTGKYLKFEVTPVSDTAPTTGAAVLSAASSQVTEAAFVQISPYPLTLNESASNAGSLGDLYVTVKISNCAFTSGTITGISMIGLPAGLGIGTITRVSNSEINVYFSGAATAHEYAASVLDPNSIKVKIPANMLVGVTNELETSNGFYLQFANNAPTNLAISAVGHSWIQLGWDAPAGLISNSSTGLSFYKVYRDNQYLTQIAHNSSKSTFSYKDTSASPGVSHAYKIEAVYANGGNSFSPVKNGTALGFSAFAISNPAATGTIDQDNKTISLALPSGTALTNLVATFTAPGATVKIGSITQISGSTANDFTNPVTYTLSTADGSSSTYTVSAILKLAAPSLIETGLQETTSSFTARWNTVSAATGYRLDVSADSNFSTLLSAYENLDTGTASSWVINNIAANTTYYYRVRAIAADPLRNSSNSATGSVTTLATTSGAGNTIISNSNPCTVNMGSFTAGADTVSPYLVATPTAFSSSTDNSLSVSMGLGTAPEGLLYNLSFENPSIGNGSFNISYSGLSYDPTDVRYRLGGGGLITPDSFNVNTETKLITILISGLSKNAKAAYELQIVTNDESAQTLPIQLSSFTALVISNKKVRLDWTTQSESGIMGFHLLRNTSTDLSTALIVSPMIEATNTSTTTTYSFTDSTVPGDGIYSFWLQTTDFDGLISQYGPVIVVVGDGNNPSPEIPLITALNSPYPNPFNPDVTVCYDLAEEANVKIKIYNSRGQLVRNLIDIHQQAKTHTVNWDGKDDSGNTVASGTYFIRMKAGTYSGFKKVVMLK
jgi:hypothetical protein